MIGAAELEIGITVSPKMSTIRCCLHKAPCSIEYRRPLLQGSRRMPVDCTDTPLTTVDIVVATALSVAVRMISPSDRISFVTVIGLMAVTTTAPPQACFDHSGSRRPRFNAPVFVTQVLPAVD